MLAAISTPSFTARPDQVPSGLRVMPPKYRDRPHITKPFAGRDLLGVLAEAISRPVDG